MRPEFCEFIAENEWVEVFMFSTNCFKFFKSFFLLYLYVN